MANAIYPLWKQELLQGTSGTALAGNVRAILVDLADYTYSATDEFIDDIIAGARVAISANLSTKTFVNGLFDADNLTFSSVTGDVAEAVVLYLHTGVESTSRLIAYFDTGVTGLPVTPNGGDINLNFNASGIFQL